MELTGCFKENGKTLGSVKIPDTDTCNTVRLFSEVCFAEATERKL